MQNFYYSIITDRNLVLDRPQVYQDTTHYILLAVIIPLILIGFFMPILMVYLDASDYNKVEDNYYKVSEEMVGKLLEKRKEVYQLAI